MNRAVKANNPMWTEMTVIASLGVVAGQVNVLQALAHWIWGTGAGSIGGVGSVGGGRAIVGLEWSSSTGHDILLGINGLTPLGQGFKIDADDSYFMPCNGIPPWLTYQCAGRVDVVIHFDPSTRIW